MSRYDYAFFAAGVAVSVFAIDQLLVRSKRQKLNYFDIQENKVDDAIAKAKRHFDNPTQENHLVSIEKHVLTFGKLKSGKVYFNTFTTAFALRKLGEPLWWLIGFAIATGSKLQAGKCPLGAAEFDIKKGLHLGTSRIWDENGNVNNDRLMKLLADCKDEHGFISQTAWHHAVEKSAKKDQPEENTNRKIGTGVHGEKAQLIAAKKEAHEMFKLFGMKHNNDLVMPSWLITLFFEDTRVALRVVKELKLSASQSVTQSERTVPAQ